jgi:uncharacterized protein DUF3179
LADVVYRTMLIPLIILAAAVVSAGLTAFGADPRWMLHPHGLSVIMLARRWQWALLGVSLLGCAAILVMVVAGRWRAWWLMGLAPILALFAHRFVTDAGRAWEVDAEGAFVSADQVHYVRDADWVVGLSFDGEDYAYPYNVLYDAPVVALAVPRRRVLLFWSPYANRAVAAETDWTFKPRELEVVSMPANALLVYNARLGQFINGLTGATPEGEHFTGWLSTVPTSKMTFGQWRQGHARTLVLQPPEGWRPGAPAGPVAPRYAMPNQRAGRQEAAEEAAAAAAEQVALIDTPRPCAVREADVGRSPLNMLAGVDPLLLFRGEDGSIRAFERQANGDLTPRFYPVTLAGHPSIALTENDSRSAWTADGLAVAGPLKGEKLKPFEVDDRVNLEVIRYWYPDLRLLVPTAADVGRAPAAAKASRRKSSRRRARRAAEGATAGQVTASF